MSEQWIWRSDRIIPSQPAAGRQVLDEVIAQLDAHGWPQHDVFSVQLAMEEALVNAIQHGNGRDAQKQIHVSCWLSSDRIRIEIADQGHGFNPDTLPDPTCRERLYASNGRGVMLMKAFMSRVQYNAVGNCVALEKQRGAAEHGAASPQ